MRIFSRQIYPRILLGLLKDALIRFFDIIILSLKRDGETNFSFIDKYSIERIIEYYGEGWSWSHQIDKMTGSLGYGFIHYALVRNLRPSRVLCIGSGRGFVPAICTLACKENKKGFVDFVDAGYDQNHPSNWGGDGFWKKVDSKKHFALLGLSRWIKIYVMTSESFANKFPNRTYGYIYIDGDHSYEGVRFDYQVFWPKLRRGGFMAFHDITAKRWKGFKGVGVWKFWQEIKSDYKIVFPLKGSGLGIIQK